MGFVADSLNQFFVADNILEDKCLFIIIQICFFTSGAFGDCNDRDIVSEFADNIFCHIEMPLSPVNEYQIWQRPIILETAATPASSSAACTTGMIQWDANFVYVCVATNTWKRSGLSSF